MQTDDDKVLSKEGLKGHIANQLKTILNNMKEIQLEFEEIGWWP